MSALLPALPAPVAPRPPEVQRFRLDNGLGVHLVSRRTLPIVDIALVIRAGAELDGAARAGRARFTGALLVEGTERRDGRAFAEAVDRLGAVLDVQTAWDHTTIALHVLAPRLAAALALVHEALTRPAFAASEFERKRRERLAALLQDRSEPRALATFHFARGVYGRDHPYGQPIGGTTPSVRALPADETRRCHALRYRPDNAFLVVVGDIDEPGLRTLLDDSLAGWQAPPSLPPPGPAPAPSAPAPLVLVDRPGAAQTELRIGQAAAPRSTPDYFPLLVLNAVLGGNFTSRINMRLREERGYTYGAGSSFAFRRGGGPFVVGTSVHGAATGAAVADVWAELERVRAEPVGEPELERARRSLTLGLAREFETTGAVADRVAEQVLYGLGESWFEQYVARIEAVDARAVQSAAGRWLDPAGRVSVAVGDRAVIEPGLAALGPISIASEPEL